MKPTQEQVIAWAQCPCCGLQWDKNTEQHACIELFGECIPCRFVPNSKGTRSGSNADIDAIQERQRDMISSAIRARMNPLQRMNDAAEANGEEL